ncbi:hypothetical protein SAMN06265795_106133 [Noviherbaspirillum humi]|uniref:UPF0125 protein SAMN06265795_106133 n=1 Tax=Noviherbaspirillum humi TaxID=1688639 RepID=A0A239HB14_9BURK|nr:RnfH family protein [Noviherbaspirillum humi]SNS77444.1 hypothetical protein SAMN06265795_106133 [Noviherbaspirillum humi]
MANPPEITVEVCYARPDGVFLKELRLPEAGTLQQAIIASGVLGAHPEIDLESARVGVFGKLKTLDAVLRDRDRVEIYRPLLADPKESRRQRAAKRHAEK